jgi:nitrite reductase (NADH) small subunit
MANQYLKETAQKQSAVCLGPIDKISPGHGVCFIVEEKEIAVFRSHGGGFSAISNRCPHRNGPLCDGLADEHRVICPYHSHKFDLHSGAGSEATEKVTAYRVWEEGGELWLQV